MIRCDIGEEEIDERGKCEKCGNEELVAFVFYKEKEPKETKKSDNKEAVEKKDGTDMDGTSVAQDSSTFVEATEELEECFADHFVVRDIQKEITQKEEAEKESGEDKGLPRMGTPEGTTTFVTEENKKRECEKSKALDAGKGKE